MMTRIRGYNMNKLAIFFGVLLSFSYNSAAAETIELRCSTFTIDSEGGVTEGPYTDEPTNITFDTADQSVQFGATERVPATHWDEEIIAWSYFNEEHIVFVTNMFNRLSGLLFIKILASYDLRDIDAGLTMRNDGNYLYRCGRTF